jgi:hypothetical protein
MTSKLDQPTDFKGLLLRLKGEQVEFIVVGGAAGVALGSPRVTFDLDILYRRSGENLDRLVAAVQPLDPYPRGAPPKLPFKWDRRTLDFGLNFTLRTSIGFIDLLGEIAGGTYEALLPHSAELPVFGVQCRCLDLESLIRTKRAAGRPKDFEAIAELELLKEQRDRST